MTSWDCSPPFSILLHLEKEIRYQREMGAHFHHYAPIDRQDDGDASFLYLYPYYCVLYLFHHPPL
jgi:hypothetical protein